MSRVLQIDDRTLTTEEIIPLLASYELVPQFLRENIINQAITSISCTMEETTQACQELYQQWCLISEEQRQAWRVHYGLSQEQVEQLATRKLRIEKFKQVTWGHKLESYFLQRKGQLDRVIYSLIRVQDREVATELFFRIREAEQSFAELAEEYSQGPEARTAGRIGPIERGKLHPKLAELLSISQIGVVCPPVRLGEWQVIVRLEKLIPVRLDEEIRQRLLNEKFEAWLKEQIHQLSHYDQLWMGILPNQQINLIENLAA